MASFEASAIPLVTPAHHGEDGNFLDFGLKVVGLWRLPESWVPTHFAVSGTAYDRWASLIDSGSADPVASAWSVLGEPFRQAVASIGGGTLIVRSSSRDETIKARGRFQSQTCSAHHDSAIQAVVAVWTYARALGGRSVGLAIQAFVRGRLVGHVSNERRVARTAREWLCEIEGGFQPPQVWRFRAGGSTALPSHEAALACRAQRELKAALRSVAADFSGPGPRLHLEWVWDGKLLWIVQRDEESVAVGHRPSHSWRPNAQAQQVPKLELLVPEELTVRPFRKLDCLRVFRQAGLSTAPCYVLEESQTITDLAAGIIATSLVEDLRQLLSYPIVIRTDVLDQPDVFGLNLPRTDCVDDIAAATRFLTTSSRMLLSSGLHAASVCFILHRFIAARSSAWAFARPSGRRVRIDATWGLPDGLGFYPHDSFEADDGRRLQQHLRCKTHYLGVDRDGHWIPRVCDAPFDWRPSLKRSELAEIASGTSRVAQLVGKPVQVMYFVDCEPALGYPRCLPWFMQQEDIRSTAVDRSSAYYAGDRLVVRRDADLLSLQTTQGNQPFPSCIVLNPDVALLRDSAFLERVADTAIRHNLPVELQGSILSHAYFILARTKARVRCVDPFQPDQHRQQFGKLVRDLIPTRISKNGERVRLVRVDGDELLAMLKAKAVEEALELFFAATPSQTLEELADLLEVVESAVSAQGGTVAKLRETAKRKRQERGGFEKGLILMETAEVPLIEDADPEPDLLGIAATETSVDIASSRRQIERGRRPRVRGGQVIIPLVPPRATGERSFNLDVAWVPESLQVTFRDKEVVVRLAADSRPRDQAQLDLFGSTAESQDLPESN